MSQSDMRRTKEHTYDVIVIGSGVIGGSIAYHIVQRGRRVLVIERGEVAGVATAYWASAGGVRRQGRHPAEALLAIEAIGRWPSLEAELGADLHYRQGGNLLLAESEAEQIQLIDFVEEQRKMGFTDVRLLDRYELHRLVADLGEQVVAGSYSPQDGQADPARTTRAFAAAASRHGAEYWINAPVQALLLEGRSVVGVRSERGVAYAGQVVLAAGAWSNSIAASIGLQLPLHTHALQMLLSSPAAEKRLQPVVSALGKKLSLKQLPDGAYLIGGGWEGDVTEDQRSYTLRPASVTGNWEAATAILPAVGQQQIVRSWCGLEAVSRDDIPFVGQWTEGLVVAAGFSGHGFAISPAVGRCVADLLMGRPVPELDGLKPGREMRDKV